MKSFLFGGLNPRLADANKSAELEALVEAEEQRHQDALQSCKEEPSSKQIAADSYVSFASFVSCLVCSLETLRQDRDRMASVLRDACESFVCPSA